MRPLSAVPMRTLPPSGAGATAKAVTDGELPSTSVPPSGRRPKTALRAAERSLRLRLGVEDCAPALLSSTPVMATLVVTVPPEESPLGVADVLVPEGRALDAASLRASA